MATTRILLVTGVVLCAVVVGCADPQAPKPDLTPVHVRGTIAQYAGYVGPSYRVVQGAGVVVMLGENGSSEVPGNLRRYLVRSLQNENLGFYRHRTEHLHPERILRDKDTAVVEITGAIPYGAPKGTRFNIQVKATAQTRSLDGGHLMPSDLQLREPGRTSPTRDAKTWGLAAGSVFLSPYFEGNNASELRKDASTLRNGQIIGGGKVIKALPVSLVLAQPESVRCRNIVERINERFREPYDDVAKGLDSSVINLHIPAVYHSEPRRFLALVLHLPLVRTSGQVEKKIREVVKAMYSPDALHEELALVLEAIGPRAIPMLQSEYSSADPYVAYYAARTGLRLKDASASSVVTRTAGQSGSPLQFEAVQELGRHPALIEAVPVLRELVNDKNLVVRIAASEALIDHGDSRTVRLLDVGKRFELAVVKSSGSPVIYASQTNKERLLLLGDPIRIATPVLYDSPDELVSIVDSVTPEGNRLRITRKVPRGEGRSDPLQTGFTVASLARTMGAPAEKPLGGDVQGLSLTYGQVLRVLYGMCQAGHIKAEFVLERPGASQIERWSGGIERPDAGEL